MSYEALCSPFQTTGFCLLHRARARSHHFFQALVMTLSLLMTPCWVYIFYSFLKATFKHLLPGLHSTTFLQGGGGGGVERQQNLCTYFYYFYYILCIMLSSLYVMSPHYNELLKRRWLIFVFPALGTNNAVKMQVCGRENTLSQ